MGLALLFAELGASAVLLNVIERGRRQRHTHPIRCIDVGSFVEGLSEPVLLLNDRGKVVELNHAAENLISRSRKACRDGEQRST